MSGEWIIAYDIADVRRRQRVARRLEAVGTRLQRSVFRCRLSRYALRVLQADVASVIDPAEDRVRWYPICAHCERRLTGMGAAPPAPGDGTDFTLV